MPVEIKELVIRTSIGRADADECARDSIPVAMAEGAQDTADTHAIVQECVRQVLRILAAQKER